MTAWWKKNGYKGCDVVTVFIFMMSFEKEETGEKKKKKRSTLPQRKPTTERKGACPWGLTFSVWGGNPWMCRVAPWSGPLSTGRKSKFQYSWCSALGDTPPWTAESAFPYFRSWLRYRWSWFLTQYLTLNETFQRSRNFISSRSTRCHYRHQLLGANPSLRQMTKL